MFFSRLWMHNFIEGQEYTRIQVSALPHLCLRTSMGNFTNKKLDYLHFTKKKEKSIKFNFCALLESKSV